ncbi:MAG: TonB-dependent receptor [Xanthomonadales bacterium]|nr:TonB-dependent receptor [Xanthomonadales bacterium]
MMWSALMWSSLWSFSAITTMGDAGMDGAAVPAQQQAVLPPVTVNARAIDASQISASEISAEQVARRGAHHPQELFTSVPGAWISRGSGQELLTAIRSPVLTGAGACGAFLVLEDQIPVRPAGFCNVNGLFELNLRQANGVQVLRGPGLASHGANALHGVIDVATPESRVNQAFIEGGSQNYRRLGLQLHAGDWQLAANHTKSDSFRADESFRHNFINVRQQMELGRFTITNTVSLADLDQQTAGFVFGEDAFRDEVLRRSNQNPEAFRDAYAIRAASHWRWQGSDGTAYRLTPFVRHSEMEFLQHFLPGQPLERNRQSSAGVQFSLTDPAWAPGLSLGADVDGFHGDLNQFQAEALTTGSAFLQATRPQGAHYDYRVNGLSTALWGRYLLQGDSGWQAEFGLRGEWLGYDYNNRLAAGNLRDDGTACGFGGCLYTRPDDRSDDFLTLAPSARFSLPLGSNARWEARYARAFRPPQATELYRLQSGQNVADIGSEVIDGWSLGIVGAQALGAEQSLRYELTGFYQLKRDVILRDAEGFNVSGGRTRHLGLEWALSADLSQQWQLNAAGTWANHEYAFTRTVARGEEIRSGATVDTAPKHIGSVELAWRPREALFVGVRGEYIGAYPLTAENDVDYGGHTLFHLEAQIPLTPSWRTVIRARNLFAKRYAERADFAFGNFRYFPGQGRSLFVELNWRERAN